MDIKQVNTIKSTKHLISHFVMINIRMNWKFLDENEAKAYVTDIDLRIYTSNLLGRSDELVLYGGSNTSVKSVVNGEDILFLKGSGWDLVTIKKEGFALVKLKDLQQMATLEVLSDSDMVRLQKEAMIDKPAPTI